MDLVKEESSFISEALTQATAWGSLKAEGALTDQRLQQTQEEMDFGGIKIKRDTLLIHLIVPQDSKS